MTTFNTENIPKQGVFHEESQYYYIYPKQEWEEQDDHSFLVIGGAGCDGILFVLKKNDERIWGYYPIDNEYLVLGENYSEFISGWLAGKIVV